jgi:hypothetical protein
VGAVSVFLKIELWVYASPSAAEYFHLVAPGPVLGRILKKGHLQKRMFG